MPGACSRSELRLPQRLGRGQALGDIGVHSRHEPCRGVVVDEPLADHHPGRTCCEECPGQAHWFGRVTGRAPGFAGAECYQGTAEVEVEDLGGINPPVGQPQCGEQRIGWPIQAVAGQVQHFGAG